MNNLILRAVLFISMCMTILTLSNPIEQPPVLEKRLTTIPELVEAIKYNLNYTGGIRRNVFFNGIRTLDVYYDKETTEVKKPVVIYILGGAWISGDKALYTDLGAFLSDEEYVAVIPNYVLFPAGQVEDMIEDVYKSIKWTFKNIEKYGGDSSRVSIVGHSSGAHLVALTLFKSSLKLNNKGSALKRLPVFENTVLLNGPYDFDVFSLMRKETNETPEGSLIEKFAELLLGSKNSSPTDILEKYGNKSVKLTTKSLHIVNGSADEVVPTASSEEFYEEVKRALSSSVNVKYTLLEGYLHSQLVNGVCYDTDNDRELFLDILNNRN